MRREASEAAKRSASVAASGSGVDPDGGRLPAGEVHGWWHGHNETVCGLSLSKSQLVRFGALRWTDVQPDSGGHADLVQVVCPRCGAALTARGGSGWRRTSPRP
ncbi:MAG TPA: hypothetical protein VFR07_03845 [Mycobacteriales bacterium]|jgi:hypothetical protein|nr:hypothetical protein [Mycobacteriales bacterium]